MLFKLKKSQDINKSIEEFHSLQGAVLLDVRTKQEYEEGHIDGSINIPLDELKLVKTKYQNKETPLLIYCRSGARSGTAADLLKQNGYTNAKNIGGIIDYHGQVIK